MFENSNIESSNNKSLISWKYKIGELFQIYLDKTIPYTSYRWIITFFIMFFYILRVSLIGGWYIVTYALGIYLLNILIGFLSPMIDPAQEIENDEEEATLPTSADDEFKPFIRRVPEFKFWYSVTKACLIAFFCTFFPFLNIPVFWPILLIYFLALFFVTMKKQIKHMYTYKYIPFVNWKKPTYSSSKGKTNAT